MNNQEFQRHRLVLAYHGCDQSVADKVIIEGEHLQKSENSYDWLGKGIYFWEHGPNRAMEWAEKHPDIENPAVVGAVINLGNCFDLFDRQAVKILCDLYPIVENSYLELGKTLPANEPGFKGDTDDLKRHLDCTVINWILDELDALTEAEMESAEDFNFDSVRGLFPEGEPVFEGSSIMAKSHIQIAVRNAACVLGYFKPS